MGKKVETGVFVSSNTPAWTGNSTVLDTDGKLGLDVPTALHESGLDWEVKKVPIFAKFEGKQAKVEGRWGVQRQTDGRVFGTVGKTWQPMQNADGFAVLQTLLEQAGGEIWIESAGALDGGKKVWILARCARELQIAGESYKSYIGFTNGHDGRTSVTAFMCDMRSWCSNMMNFVWNSQSERILRVRHTKQAAVRIAEAHHVLGLRNTRLDELAKTGEWMVDQPFSDGAFEMFLESLMPLPDDAITTTGGPTPAATMIASRRDAVANLYATATNLDPIRGTKWGALQSVIEYVDHGRVTKNTDALAKTQMGLTPSTLEQRAFDLLRPKASLV